MSIKFFVIRYENVSVNIVGTEIGFSFNKLYLSV
jgi:hypothetical protein